MNKGLEAQQQIFAAHPDDRRAFEALEEHFFLEGDWPALVRVYRDRLEAPTIRQDPAQQGALLFRLGQILEDRILDLDGAAETYWTLARLDRTHRPALRQLRGIHARRGQWDMVLQLAELEGATAMPPYERAQFEADLGRIWHRELGDRSEAERAYQRALDASADFPPALEGLAGLLLEAGRPDEASRVLERLTRCLRGPERAPFWLALGRLCTNALDDRERARQCFAAALEDDPLLTAAVEWALLLATEAEDWSSVAGLLEHRFDLASGARHRASIAVEASQIHLHHCRSAAGARAWVDRAIELAEDDGAVLRARADVERAEGNDGALAKVLERLVQKAGRRAPRSLFVELAEALARGGRPEAALAALDRTERIATPGDLPLLALRTRLLRETDAKRELAEALELQCDLDPDAPPATRIARVHELARLYEDDLADAGAAEEHWQAAFALDPRDPDALSGLDRLQRKREDWNGLRHTYESALSAAGPEPDATLCCRLGSLLLERFDDPDTARRRFEQALGRDAHHAEALAGLRRVAERRDDSELLLAVCEREAETCEDAQRFGEIAQRALSTLVEGGALDRALVWAVRAGERLPDSRTFLEARADLEQRLERPEDEIATLARLAPLLQGTERAKRLLRRATLLLDQDDAPAAAACLEAAHASAPSRVDVLEALVDCRRRLGEPRDEADALRRLCDRLPEAERTAPFVRLAALLEDPIGDLDAAITARRALTELERPPEDAADALARLLELAGRHAELATVLERERARFGDGSREARDLDLRRGRLLLDALGDCDGAAVLFAALHERDPENDEVLELLERALRAGHDAAGLCDLLARRAGWENDPVARSALALERAQLLEEVLGRPEEACDVYASMVAESADAETADRARDRLEALCESTGQWVRLRELLEGRLAATPEPERTAIRLRLASICRDRLQDPAGCAGQLEAVVATRPERVEIWQQIQDLHLRVLDRPADWLRVAQAELSSVPTPRRELVLRIAMGRLLLDASRRPQHADLDDAIEHYERAFQLDPSHAEAAEVLARHYDRTHRPEELVRVLEAHLAQLDEARIADRDDLRLRLARVHLDALGDARRARPLLESVYAVRGALPEVAEPLAGLLEHSPELADAELLARLCRERIARCGNERDRSPWEIRLARACVRLDALDEAVVAYRSILSRQPSEPALEDELIALYERRREHAPLIDLLERRLPYASADAALALRLRLAALHETEADGAPVALGHLEAILDEVPHHADALERALALAARIDDPLRTRALLDHALRLPLAPSLRATCLENRAALAGETAEEVERAIEDLRAALALEPDRLAARRALRTRLAALERWPAVLETLGFEAGCATGEGRTALLEEAADLAESRLGPDAAIPWLARLRAERPDDAELWARLATLHTRAGRYEAALRARDAEAGLRSDPAGRLAVHLERARLLEQALDAPGRAVLAYQAALPLAAERAPVLAELDRLLARLGRPLERAAVLEERVAALAGREGIALRRTLAELYCNALARPESALPHLRANVAATTDRPEEELHHLGVLGTALRASNLETEWSPVAERELELLSQHAALRQSTPLDYQRFLREETARILDQRLGDPERALERIRALCDDPALAGEEVPDRIREALFDLLRRLGATAELADRLTRFAETGRASGRAWLELATLREELNDFPAAFAAYRAACGDVETRLAALEGRTRCAERLQDAPALALAMREALELEPALSRAERADLARRLGALCWPRLGRADEARDAYRTALELDANDAATLQAWIELEEACGAREDRLGLYRRALEIDARVGDDRARRAALYRRLAAAQGEQPDEARAAIETWLEAERFEALTAADDHRLARLHAQVGDWAAFAERFGRWCDRSDGDAGVADHLDLARHLAEAGDAGAAFARAERAVAADPEHAGAWVTLAELARATGRPERALEAHERAARHASGLEAAAQLVSAGHLAEAIDRPRARALFARAVEADPACFEAHAALARSADQLDAPRDVVRHAERALDLAAAHDPEPASRLALALLGGRAARRIDERDAALRCYRTAYELDADCIEALDGFAEASFEAGDLGTAKALLERRLSQPGEGPARARQLWMAGCALEAEGALDRAAERQREALALDPALDPAHERLVALEERAARPAQARAALAVWARASNDPHLRARAALRAGEHAWAEGDLDAARSELEWATQQDSELGEAWVLLCEVASRSLDATALRPLCRRALASMPPGVHSARVALRLARLEEIAGDHEQAITHYAEAWRWDPRCSEAALCESRLARMAGDWIEADGLLARYLDAHPDPESPSLAQVHLERGRLLSGPLEAFEDAILAYRRALALQPGLAVAKSALAALLLHAPDRWREALALHREILAVAPTTTASLRALATLAEGRGQTEVLSATRTVLAALGQSPRDEVDLASPTLGLVLQAGPPLSTPEHERLRRIAHLLRDELPRILPDASASSSGCAATADPTRDTAIARERLLAIEGELAAPSLSALPAEDGRTLFLAIGGVFLDPGGNGGDARLRDALDANLGLWTRRKLRRLVEETDMEALGRVDYAAFGHALRALAAAMLLDREPVALRAVILALLALDPETRNADEPLATELGGRVALCEAAKRLLVRITTALAERLERGR
ncbi:MAG: tetratricopeptide repeat protein [Myxococcota bacterium]